VAKGQALKDSHDFQGALTFYETVLSKDPNNLDVLNEKGNVYFLQ
jgi:hypothetical protein